MKKILELLDEIEIWNDGDKDTFNRAGELLIDGNFVFVNRKKTINKLKKLLVELK
jgi:hypothetical protein